MPHALAVFNHPFLLHDLAIKVTFHVSHALYAVHIHHKDEIGKAVQRSSLCYLWGSLAGAKPGFVGPEAHTIFEKNKNTKM